MSLVPIRVEPMFTGISLSSATGFFYRFGGRTFLITNWHVVTGRHPETQGLLPGNSTAAVPDSLKLHVPMWSVPSGQEAIRWQQRLCPLFESSSSGRPLWTEHPLHGGRVDVVALPLGGLEDTAILAANEGVFDLERLDLYPSLDVYVLGYPIGMYGGARFPIWKRGSIASEPTIDVDGLPRFYIDTATRQGMSGAPVYAQEVGIWGLQSGVSSDTKLGKGRSFVGVYAGRIGAEDEFKAQLGVVWKAGALLEVLSAVPPSMNALGA